MGSPKPFEVKCAECKKKGTNHDLKTCFYTDLGRIYLHEGCKTPFANKRFQAQKKRKKLTV